MKNLLTLVSLIATLPLLASELPWRFSQRDVYVNGSIDRSAIVYRASDPQRTMVVSDALRRVVIFDEEARTTQEVSKRRLTTSGDLTHAALDETSRGSRTRLTKTMDGVLAARLGRTDLVVTPHESSPGPITPATLARDYPVWGKLSATYTPQVEALRRLSTIDEPVDITVVFATWCGDSRREVPRLLRSIEQSNNRNLNIRLIGLGSDFEPLDLVQERHIINVPTIIVERNGVEIGRIVETPASEHVEQDLADILSGTPAKHEGRWEREQQIASGTYTLTFDDGRRGTETWRLFSTENGGQLAHSVIDDGTLVREVWHRVDEHGNTTFVEVTDEAGETLRRTRYRLRGQELRAHSRGSSSGIIDQTLALPEDCPIVTGAVATAGWSCRLPDRSTVIASVRYDLPLGPASVIGTTRTVRLDRSGEVEGYRTGIPVRAEHVRASDENVTTDLWIDSDLGIPLRLDGGGMHAELVELELG